MKRRDEASTTAVGLRIRKPPDKNEDTVTIEAPARAVELKVRKPPDKNEDIVRVESAATGTGPKECRQTERIDAGF